ncbi:response regulator [Halothiobacillus sp. DCM-1]|uniref:response regulator n=1 Tax=Halothiobacillus sp. DCM-1 TaxID=3112558 RepID=UPI0032515B3F
MLPPSADLRSLARPARWRALSGQFTAHWPLLLGVVLGLPVASALLPAHCSPWISLGCGILWLLLWLGLWWQWQTRHTRPDFRRMARISGQQIAEINQNWITPLGHIRAATDALAVTNEQAGIHERLTPELAIIRAANAELRLAVENVLDYYEATTGRLKATPRKTDIRLQIEDVVAEWQIPAQPRVGLIQYICFQDMPEHIEVDTRLLRRLLDNLLMQLLVEPNLTDCCVTLLECEPDQTAATDIPHFELIIDGRPPAGRQGFGERSPEQDARRPPDNPLLMGNALSLWLIDQFTALLNGRLTQGATRADRVGFRLQFPAHILTPHQPEHPWLEGVRCAVLTESTLHAQAWRGQLSALGADLVLDPINQSGGAHPPLDCLFLDSAQWHVLSTAHVGWFNQMAKNTRIIGLCSQLSLRGRPQQPLEWAEFTLPLFIRQRVLQTLLPRIVHAQSPLPVIPATRPQSAPRAATPGLPSFSGRTALVIDDDRIYRAHLINLLKQLGVDVLIAADGKTGISTAEHADLDLILTDMHLPDILGTGIVRMVRKQPRHLHTPIIAITANIQTSVHQALLDTGADMVLGKPISLGELINAISQFFAPTLQEPPAQPLAEIKTDEVLDALLCDELPIYRQHLLQPHDEPSELRHLAHKLRGAAACCQARQLQTLAGQLEDQLGSSTFDPVYVSQLQTQLVHTIDQTLRERHCAAQRKPLKI